MNPKEKELFIIMSCIVGTDLCKHDAGMGKSSIAHGITY